MRARWRLIGVAIAVCAGILGLSEVGVARDDIPSKCVAYCNDPRPSSQPRPRLPAPPPPAPSPTRPQNDPQQAARNECQFRPNSQLSVSACERALNSCLQNGGGANCDSYRSLYWEGTADYYDSQSNRKKAWETYRKAKSYCRSPAHCARLDERVRLAQIDYYVDVCATDGTFYFCDEGLRMCRNMGSKCDLAYQQMKIEKKRAPRALADAQREITRLSKPDAYGSLSGNMAFFYDRRPAPYAIAWLDEMLKEECLMEVWHISSNYCGSISRDVPPIGAVKVVAVGEFTIPRELLERDGVVKEQVGKIVQLDRTIGEADKALGIINSEIKEAKPAHLPKLKKAEADFATVKAKAEDEKKNAKAMLNKALGEYWKSRRPTPNAPVQPQSGAAPR